MIEAYNEGLKEFNKGDTFFAGKNLMKLSFCIHNLFGLLDQLSWLLMFFTLIYILMMQFMN